MPYLMLDDFAAGIDLRKSAITAKPGTLRNLTNGLVTPGGEIVKRKTFSSIGTLPSGTHGLTFDPFTEELVVFGLAASVSGLPAWTRYVQIPQGAGSSVIDRILDVQWFEEKPYVIARFSNGAVVHSYDGVEVPAAQVAGQTVTAHKSKLYVTDGANLRFSALLDATDWTVGAGNGVIDVSAADALGADLVGVSEYFGALAVFGQASVQIWQMDPDPLKNTLVQTLGGTGLLAPQAVARYGNGDVLFLSDTGLRSLRARDSSNSAAINDVGSPLDAIMAARRDVLTPALADRITAAVDPLSGRFWLFYGSEIFVLSTFPNSKISAWSRLTFPGIISYSAVARSRLVVRPDGADELFIYGTTPSPDTNPFSSNTATGSKSIPPWLMWTQIPVADAQDPLLPEDTNNAEYDDTQLIVQTPFLDANTPGTLKRWTGLDVSCDGEFDVYAAPYFETPDAWTRIGTVSGATWERGKLDLGFTSTRIALKFVSKTAFRHKLASVAVHYDEAEAS